MEESIETADLKMTVALAFVGVVAIGVWSDLVGYSSALVPLGAAQMAGGSGGYVLGRLLLAIAFIVWARRAERIACPLALAVGAAASGVAALLALAARSTPDILPAINPSLVADAGACVGSLGFSALSALLFISLARAASPRLAALCAGLAIAAQCVCSALVDAYTGVAFQLLLCTALPLVAGICAATCWNRQPALADGATSGEPSVAWARGARDASGTLLMLLQAALAALLAAILRSLSAMGPWGAAHAGFMGTDGAQPTTVAIACVVVLAVIAVAFVLPRRLPTQVGCAIALAVVIVGLHGTSIGDHSGTLTAATMGCQMLARVLMWIAFMECVRQLAIPGLRVNGIVSLCNVAGSAAVMLGVGAGVNASTLVMVLVYVLLTSSLVAVALPHIGRDEAPQADSLATEAPSPGEPTSPVHAFAAAHAISPREEDVLALLLEGRTRGQIERLLGLSEGTVRTHVNAVYRKAGVHSKAELSAAYEAHAHPSITP